MSFASAEIIAELRYQTLMALAYRNLSRQR